MPLRWHDRDFLIYDTAGMRRRSKIDEKLEKLSVGDALNAIRFAHVVVVLMDSERTFEDRTFASPISSSGKAARS